MLFAQGGGAIPHFAAGGTVKKAAPKKVAPPKNAGKVNPHVDNQKVYGTAANEGAIDYYDWLDENTRRRAAEQEEVARPDEFRERPTWVASVPTIEGGRYAPGSIGPTGRAYLQGAPGNTMATQVYKNAYTPGKITTAEGKLLDPVAVQKAWGDQFRARQAENAALWDAYSKGGSGAGTPAQGPAKFYPAGSQGPHGETITNPGGLWSTDLPGAAAAAAPRPTMPWDYRGTAVSGAEGLSRAGDYWSRPTTAAPKAGTPNVAAAAQAASGSGGGFQNFSGGSGSGGGGQPVPGGTPSAPTDQRYGAAGNQFDQMGRQPGKNGFYMPTLSVNDQYDPMQGGSRPVASMPAGTGGWVGWENGGPVDGTYGYEDGGPVFYRNGGGVFYFDGGLVRYRNGGPVRSYEEGGAVAGAIPSPTPFRQPHFADGGGVEPSYVIQRGGSEAQSPDPITLTQAKQRITDRQQAYKVGLTQGDIDRAKSDPSRYGPYYGPGGEPAKKDAKPAAKPKPDVTTTGSTRVIKESRTKDDEPQPYPEDPKAPGWPRPVDPDRFKRDEPAIPEPEKPKGPTTSVSGLDDLRDAAGSGSSAGPGTPVEYAPYTIGTVQRQGTDDPGDPELANRIAMPRRDQEPIGVPRPPRLQLPSLPSMPGLPQVPRGAPAPANASEAGLGGGQELPGPPVPTSKTVAQPAPRLPQAPPGMVMVTLPNGQQTFVPEEQANAYSGAVARPPGAFARGGAVPHFEGGGGMDQDSVYGANANYAAAVQRGAVAPPTQALPGTPGAIPTPGAPPNAIAPPAPQQAPPSANSAGMRPADQNAGPAPPPSEATMTNAPRPKERTGYYQMPDAEEIARLNKLGIDTMTATLETRARSAEGAIPTQDGTAHKEILANAFGSNALAPTSGDMKVAYDAVDPERKLSSDELTMKTLQDMTDYWYAHGRPDKAGQAAMSLMLYGKKVATGAGQQARAAFEDGDIAKGLEWLQKGYSYIPDGRTAQYKVGPDGKSAEVWFVNPDGSETEHQQMDSNGLRNLSLSMSNGSAWMQASQGAIAQASGRGGGGSKSHFSEDKRKEDQGAIDKLQAAGRAMQKNPDDEDAKRAYEDAYDDAIATTGRAALVKQADAEFRPDRYKRATKPDKATVENEKFEETVKRDEDELDTQIKAAPDDKTKQRLTTAKTWVRPTAAFNRQKVDQSIDRKSLASITEERDDAEKVAGTYQELGENVLQRNPLSARTVVRLFDQLRSGAEPKVMPDGRVQVPGFAPLYIDAYTMKELTKLGRFEPAK